MILLDKIEQQINHVLAMDEDALESLKELSGQTILMELSNTGFCVYILPSANGIQLRTQFEDSVNVTIRGTPPDMLGYMLRTKTKSGKLAGNIEVIGDVGLAQDFQSIVFNLDLDWEEQLSKWFGDTFAHKMGRLFREIGNFVVNSGDKLQQDVSEYLRFEAEMTPDRTELGEFINAVDTLRDDAERLKLRINRLEQQIKK
jgi:ubiquinone biosynthesis protein UbiJ